MSTGKDTRPLPPAINFGGMSASLPYRRNRNERSGWRAITAGEIAQNGDRYSLGNGRFAVVGTRDTFLRAGMEYESSGPRCVMCYKPQRPL